MYFGGDRRWMPLNFEHTEQRICSTLRTPPKMGKVSQRESVVTLSLENCHI